MSLQDYFNGNLISIKNANKHVINNFKFSHTERYIVKFHSQTKQIKLNVCDKIINTLLPQLSFFLENTEQWNIYHKDVTLMT